MGISEEIEYDGNFTLVKKMSRSVTAPCPPPHALPTECQVVFKWHNYMYLILYKYCEYAYKQIYSLISYPKETIQCHFLCVGETYYIYACIVQISI